MIIQLQGWDEENVCEDEDTTNPGPSNGHNAEERPKSRPVNITRANIKWNMVFTWQAPMMLMAYAVMSFLTGLVIYVCTPLYDGRVFDDAGKVRAISNSTTTLITYQVYRGQFSS